MTSLLKALCSKPAVQPSVQTSLEDLDEVQLVTELTKWRMLASLPPGGTLCTARAVQRVQAIEERMSRLHSQVGMHAVTHARTLCTLCCKAF